MVEFLLPANSKIRTGKTWRAAPGARDVRRFHVYRWTPDDGQTPRLDTYEISMAECGPMVLDVLIRIKNKLDPTLTFRRSSVFRAVRFNSALDSDTVSHADCARAAAV
jgi:succinate dehydrogenase / fumarate reductase iron-sulfur subunit